MDRHFYSQYSQDRILDTYLFRAFSKGTFVDIGAHDGRSLSNSLFFEEARGWTGVCIEPDPASFAILAAQRPTAKTLNLAVGKAERMAPFVQVSGYGQMLGGLVDVVDRERIDHDIRQRGGEKRIIEVPVRPARSILKELGIAEIHYLSIDVEGAEVDVLESFDWDAVLAHALTVECNTEASAVYVKRTLGRAGFVSCGQYESDLYLVNQRSTFFENCGALSDAIKQAAKLPVHLKLRRMVGRSLRKWGLRR